MHVMYASIHARSLILFTPLSLTRPAKAQRRESFRVCIDSHAWAGVRAVKEGRKAKSRKEKHKHIRSHIHTGREGAGSRSVEETGQKLHPVN
eukprot:6207867-Pleurochrysis_carterae.AAC.2